MVYIQSNSCKFNLKLPAGKECNWFFLKITLFLEFLKIRFFLEYSSTYYIISLILNSFVAFKITLGIDKMFIKLGQPFPETRKLIQEK